MSGDAKLSNNMWEHKTVDVLGTTYTVNAVAETTDKGLSKCAGYTDQFSKEIVVDNFENFNELYPASTLTKDVPSRVLKTVRHEIVHTFMIESGITRSSTEIKWAHDESQIEWISTMLPRMIVAMEHIGAIKTEAPCPKN